MEQAIKKTNKAAAVTMLSLMYAIMVLLSITMIFPYIYMVLTTFKPMQETVQAGIKLFPVNWTAENASSLFAGAFAGAHELYDGSFRGAVFTAVSDLELAQPHQ